MLQPSSRNRAHTSAGWAAPVVPSRLEFMSTRAPCAVILLSVRFSPYRSPAGCAASSSPTSAAAK